MTISPAEAARMLGVSADTIRKHAHNGPPPLICNPSVVTAALLVKRERWF